jgi:hypothetical protein
MIKGAAQALAKINRSTLMPNALCRRAIPHSNKILDIRLFNARIFLGVLSR